MASGESEAHLDLKRAALRWAYRNGFTCAAMEVRALRSNFRCDVVACTPRSKGGDGGASADGVSAIFECKQSRSDFLNHSFSESGRAAELKALTKRKRRLEELLAVHHPTLREGGSLFPEFDAVIGVKSLGHAGYRRLCREIERLQRGLFERSKFSRLIRYRSANLCYLVAREGIFQEHEVPEGWGVLSWDGSFLEAAGTAGEGCRPLPVLSLVSQPRLQETRKGDALEFLRRIARAATRETARAHGVPLGMSSSEKAAASSGRA